MDVAAYKVRLQAQERAIAMKIGRAMSNAREGVDEPVQDLADASVSDERTSEQITEAASSAVVLAQVRAALSRIEAGTFGLCVVDGEPIERKRIEAMPWTPYCLKHQELIEAEGPSSGTSTL